MEEMLLINERIDKLTAARTDFVWRGMLVDDRRAYHGPVIHISDETENGPVSGPMSSGFTALAQTIGKHGLLISCFPETEWILDKVHPSLRLLGVTIRQEDITILV